jgi:hypothetical protein
MILFFNGILVKCNAMPRVVICKLEWPTLCFIVANVFMAIDTNVFHMPIPIFHVTLSPRFSISRGNLALCKELSSYFPYFLSISF